MNNETNLELAFDFDSLCHHLQNATSVRELEELRRALALIRHPDRAPLSMREAATFDMAKINSLVDDAIAAKRR